ncbi:hypothetical protein VTK73DRAFT_8416 [Phialemonium thermophilum]|uniref:Small ribosomal subunit protein mS29 n=1 Tax=Phialemonium thermophilum TaxID=223376 RepID=A0ABR3W9E7_9PEZI
MIDPAKAGTVQTLPDALVDQLRASEAFKITQCWGMFRRPSVLIRSETAELSKQMEEYAANNDTLRLVITGEKLTGKSLLLLQAMAYAYLNRWVVINIPEAQELTTAATEYAPIPDTDPVQYSQPNYALKMIQAIRKANEEVLSGLETVHPHPELVQHFPVGTSVLQLANSAKEADTAWAILNALWQELTVEGHGRPPLLLSLDGLPHIMRISDYRSPAYELIHSHDLALVRRFVDHLSGASPLPNGGAVIAATTRNNAPRSPSMELALTQREIEDMARREGEGSTNVFPMPKKDPYGKGYDDRVDAALASVKVLRVRGITKAEARAIIEYWAASGLLRAAVTEATVSEKWTFGGNGILGEMEKASLLTLRM